jgi:tellurite resistance protein TehA-like permease
MVRVWLVKKGWGMILFGLILFFVVGPIVYMFIQPYTPIRFSPHPPPLPPEVSYSEWLEALDRLRAFYRMSVGSGVGAIGIFFIIFGTMYFLATTTLEYMKKRRLAHRSKI